MDKHIEMLGKIKSREDFIEFMKLHTSTVLDSSVRYYLEALTAWTHDMDGYYSNIGKEVPTDIKRDFIATLIYAGSKYEVTAIYSKHIFLKKKSSKSFRGLLSSFLAWYKSILEFFFRKRKPQTYPIEGTGSLR